MFLNVYNRFLRVLNTINPALAPGVVGRHVACLCAMFHVTRAALGFVTFPLSFSLQLLILLLSLVVVVPALYFILFLSQAPWFASFSQFSFPQGLEEV